MRHACTRAAALLLLALAAACGGEGGTPPTQTSEKGDFTMTLMRSANSQIPAIADSAMVRIWNTASGVNAVKAVAIPSPGATSQVQFSLPAGSGYSVGVVAYRWNPDFGREGLAAGVTPNVTILADQANQAAVNVLPVAMTMSGPDTLRAGTTSTLTFTFTDPALASEEMLGATAVVRVRNRAWTAAESSVIPVVGANGRVPGGFTSNITAPTVDADTALYLQVQAEVGHRWLISPYAIYFHMPSLTQGQALFRVPVKPAAGSITIVFDRDAAPR